MSDVTTEAPPALPGDGLREGIVDDLRRRLGADLEDVVLKPNDDLWVRVATTAWRPAAEALLAAGFDYFCFLSAIDWLPSPYGRGEDDPTQPPPERATAIVQGYAGGATRMQLLARVTDIRRHVGITVKTDVPDDDPVVASWSTVYAGANWHERETHEMFGIGFAGHPDLRHMYLPAEFEGHPLRKDFPLLPRIVKPWPGIVDVEPMPAEDQPPQELIDGELAPGDATPDQADAGVGVPPAEDVAEEAAVQHSVEEAPAYESPPPGDEGRQDSGAVQDPGVTPEPPEPAEPPEAVEGAWDDADAERGDAVPEGTNTMRDGGAPPHDTEDVDEDAVKAAEGDAVTLDEGLPSGRLADQEGDRSS